MNLQVNLGQTVVLDIFGHSASNGANIPADATVVTSSNDTTVATVPGNVASTGTDRITDIPVTVLAAGSTDIHVRVTTADDQNFEATATLTVATVVPGLARIELVLRATA